MKQKRQHKSSKPNTKNREPFILPYKKFKWAAITVLPILALALIASWVSHHPYFKIQQVEIKKHHAPLHNRELSVILLPYMGHSLFSLDTEKLQTELEYMGWVKHAAVRKKWPHTLSIEIQPQNPVAKWEHHGLVDKYGNVFQPEDSIPSNIPLIISNTKNLKTALDAVAAINEDAIPSRLSLTKLKIENDKLCQFSLDNGLTLLSVCKKIKQVLPQFLAAYPKVFSEKSPDGAYVDLRYPNGFAVKRRVNE